RLRGRPDHVVRGEARVELLRALSGSGGVGAAVRRPPLVPDGSRERRGGAPRGRARHRRGRRHRHGEAGAAVPRPRSAREGPLRLPGRGVPGERGVRDGEGGGGAGMDRRGTRRRRDPHRDPSGRGRRYHLLLREGRGAKPMSAGRGIRRAVALVVLALIALPGQPAGAGMDEREIGRRFLLEARGELPLIEDPAVKEYVERVGRRLVKTLGSQSFDYSFYVVQDPSLNAFAVPGGYVFVFSGLLARVKNDDELAGVLGHEIGHAAAHHIVRQQAEGQVASAASLLGLLLSAVNPVLGAGAIAAAQTAQLKYSREFEQEADYLGSGTRPRRASTRTRSAPSSRSF